MTTALLVLSMYGGVYVVHSCDQLDNRRANSECVCMFVSTLARVENILLSTVFYISRVFTDLLVCVNMYKLVRFVSFVCFLRASYPYRNLF